MAVQSLYFSKLNDGGLPWGRRGTWFGHSASVLGTVARRLDVAGDDCADMIAGIPTPWARLMLFDQALHDSHHPLHGIIVEQWRGLLGLIAIHRYLGLEIDPPVRIDLSTAQQGGPSILQAFAQRGAPEYANGSDMSSWAWNHFDIISVAGVPLGATSPHTLAFAASEANCPPCIPFQEHGQLRDPVPYFRASHDIHALQILAGWLDCLLADITVTPERSSEILALLGIERHTTIVRAIQAWRGEIDVPAASIVFPESPLLRGPFMVLRGAMAAVPDNVAFISDLALRGESGVLCWDKGVDASLIDRRTGHPVTGERVRVFGGQWLDSGPGMYMPPGTIPERAETVDLGGLFADRIIRVTDVTASAGILRYESEQYLFPFSPAILNRFSHAELMEWTTIEPSVSGGMRVVFTIPVTRPHWAVRVAHEYPPEWIVGGDRELALTLPGLACWPEFEIPTADTGTANGRASVAASSASAAWADYYYFVNRRGVDDLELAPLIDCVRRHSDGDRTWLHASTPIRAFGASADGVTGLLLVPYDRYPEPFNGWRVAVDFGSTHTTVFARLAERIGTHAESGARWASMPDSPAMPVPIVEYYSVARARQASLPNGDEPAAGAADRSTHDAEPRPSIVHRWTISGLRTLTVCDEGSLAENFLAPLGQSGRPMHETASLLIQPIGTHPDDIPTFPYNGFPYILPTVEYIPSNQLRRNLKWDSERGSAELRAFLEGIALLARAAAVREGAMVVSLHTAYPTAFSSALAARHHQVWQAIAERMGFDLAPPVSESVAVARYVDTCELGAAEAITVALDVGGSTTDIAVWSDATPVLQASVRVAAGMAGRFVQIGPSGFRTWLERQVRGLVNLDLSHWQRTPDGYRFMFQGLLRELETSGRVDALNRFLEVDNAALPLRARLAYLFALLAYYAGMMVRAAGVPGAHGPVFVCGKGARFLRLLPPDLLSTMYAHGVHGAGFGHTDGALVPGEGVKVRVSRHVKEEVARGLLAESLLGNGRDIGPGTNGARLAAAIRPIAGEHGYNGFAWNSQLDPAQVKEMTTGDVPALEQMLELKAFTAAFEKLVDPQTDDSYADVLGLAWPPPDSVHARIVEDLLNRSRPGRQMHDLHHRPDDAVIESFFVIEARAMLETVLEELNLFDTDQPPPITNDAK